MNNNNIGPWGILLYAGIGMVLIPYILHIILLIFLMNSQKYTMLFINLFFIIIGLLSFLILYIIKCDKHDTICKVIFNISLINLILLYILLIISIITLF